MNNIIGLGGEIYALIFFWKKCRVSTHLTNSKKTIE